MYKRCFRIFREIRPSRIVVLRVKNPDAGGTVWPAEGDMRILAIRQIKVPCEPDLYFPIAKPKDLLPLVGESRKIGVGQSALTPSVPS